MGKSYGPKGRRVLTGGGTQASPHGLRGRWQRGTLLIPKQCLQEEEEGTTRCGLVENTEKAMTYLAKIYEKYEDAGTEVLDVNREVDDKCDLMDEADDAAKMVTEAEKTEVAAMMEKAWERHRNVYDKVGGNVCGAERFVINCAL